MKRYLSGVWSQAESFFNHLSLSQVTLSRLIAIVLAVSGLSLGSASGFCQTRDEYLDELSLRLAVEQEQGFELASRNVMMEYCPEQAQQVLDAVTQTVQANPHVSWAYVVSAEEQWITEALRQCSQREWVDRELRQFNDQMAEHSMIVLSQVQSFLSNESLSDTDFEDLRERAELLADTLISVNLNWKEVLEQIREGFDEVTPLRIDRIFSKSKKASLDEFGEFPTQAAKSKKMKSSNPNRCDHCNKKSVVQVQCSCGGHYCMPHRHPEEHVCSFDFAAQGRERIRQQNPQIGPEKVPPM